MAIARPRSLGQCTFRSRYQRSKDRLASGFQSVQRTSAIRPDLLGYLYLPVLRPHVSISCDVPSPGITRSLGFCANAVRPPPYAFGRLPTPLMRRAHGRLRRSVYSLGKQPPVAALGRYFTPGPFRVPPDFEWQIRCGTFPVWACFSHSQRWQDVGCASTA